MSTASGLQEVLRRRSVGANAQVAVDASMAAMAIRAVQQRPRTALTPRPARALESMLSMLDQFARYKDQGLLDSFVSEDHVTSARYEGFQALAAAAAHQHPDTVQASFPELDSLLQTRSSVAIDPKTRRVTVTNRDGAASLAKVLDSLAGKLVAAANSEDRTRSSRYAVA